MKKYIYTLLLLIFCTFHFYSFPLLKNDSLKKYLHICAGSGLLFAHTRYFNDNFDSDSPGFDGRLYFKKNDKIHFVANIEHIPSANIPVWINIKSTFFDLDAHFLAPLESDRRTQFYFVFGLTMQYWSGSYTGGDIQYLIYRNKEYKTIYYGVTAGIGMEIKLYKSLIFFSELRMRVMKNEETIGLNNTLINVGLRVNLIRIPKIFRNPFDRYHWF